ncbi:MAG: putative glycoside hydrolase family 15 protein [Actinomycetota bacterium]|nr:putative glycoside hydrolase family 15 protein [Actinomycetota bacterium]
MGAAGATFSTGSTSSSAQPLKQKPAKLPARVLGGTGIIRWNPDYPRASGYERFAYIITSRFDARKAAHLPGKSLVYMSGTTVERKWSQGVTHAEALANNWLLKDESGATVLNIQYGAPVGDVGSSAYQQRFIANTLAFMKRTKVDGVFIDDVLGDPVVMAGVYPAKYPNEAAWESAMTSFVHTVGKALKARGYYVLANAAKWIEDDSRSDTGEHTAEFWARIAPGVSGLMTENWHQSAEDHGKLRVLGSNWDQQWKGWQNLVSVAQSSGADFFGLTYGSGADTKAMRYARGSFLLDWNGRGGAIVYFKTDNPDPYHPTWVRQLGNPEGAKLELAAGIWQRRYERGMVVVNATSTATTVRAYGKSYTVAGADALFVAVPRS